MSRFYAIELCLRCRTRRAVRDANEKAQIVASGRDAHRRSFGDSVGELGSIYGLFVSGHWQHYETSGLRAAWLSGRNAAPPKPLGLTTTPGMTSQAIPAPSLGDQPVRVLPQQQASRNQLFRCGDDQRGPGLRVRYNEFPSKRRGSPVLARFGLGFRERNERAPDRGTGRPPRNRGLDDQPVGSTGAAGAPARG